MKCSENGGCPFRVTDKEAFEAWEDGDLYCGAFEMFVGHIKNDSHFPEFVDCHLTSDDFPLLRAMIAGHIRYGNVSPFVITASGEEPAGKWVRESYWRWQLKEEA